MLASEKGASSWIATLPLSAHGFELPKGAFRDALCLRYGWPVPHLLTTCVCGAAMEIEHALSCRYGGLPIRRHNEVRNLLASCLRKAGCDTAIEPQLQPLSGEEADNNDRPGGACQHKGQWILGGGVRGSIFLMSGCSTRSRPRTAPCQFPPFTLDTRRRSETATKNTSAKSEGSIYATGVCGNSRKAHDCVPEASGSDPG